MNSFARTMASILGAAIVWGGLAAGQAAADGPDLSGVWKSNPNFRARQGETWTVEPGGAGYRFSVAELGLTGTITENGAGLRIQFDNDHVIGGDGQVETDPATGQAVRMTFGINTLTRQGAAAGGTPPQPVNPPPPNFGPAVDAPPPPRIALGPAVDAPPPPIDEPPIIVEPPIDEPPPPPPPLQPPPPPPPPPPPLQPPLAFPPLLFGATDPDAVIKGRYYAVKPDGSLGRLLGTFTVQGDIFKMFPIGGDEIQVMLNDAPKDGVLATDYAHYATPPIDPPVVEPGPNGFPKIGPERQDTPHNFLSISSGTLNFLLGGPTVDADMQQLYLTIARDGPTDLAQTVERRTQPFRIRFIPD
ncbi:MAG TPA: hypothetical protein VMS17_02620 [Gemmataceae bacterium]|nr:hypothetical protein [Gemmataceae bacterium]